MDQNFITTIKKMADEQGKDIFINGKWRIFLSDYLRNQYPKEGRLLRQILEANCGEYINNATNVLERKRDVMKKLDEEEGISPHASAEILDILGLILREDVSVTQIPSLTVSIPPIQTTPVSVSATPSKIEVNGLVFFLLVHFIVPVLNAVLFRVLWSVFFKNIELSSGIHQIIVGLVIGLLPMISFIEYFILKNVLKNKILWTGNFDFFKSDFIFWTSSILVYIINWVILCLINPFLLGIIFQK